MTEEREKQMGMKIRVEKSRLRTQALLSMKLVTYISMFPDKIKSPLQHEGVWRCPECKEAIQSEWTPLVMPGLSYEYFLCDCGWEYATDNRFPDELQGGCDDQ